jgi:hypothetical protein
MSLEITVKETSYKMKSERAKETIYVLNCVQQEITAINIL